MTPITLHDGMILDGGNRYRACLESGVEPRFETYDGESVVSFVLSSNMHRRHLSPGQQAAIVASAQDWSKAQVAGSNQHCIRGPVILPDLSLDTVASRQVLSGASEKTQRNAGPKKPVILPGYRTFAGFKKNQITPVTIARSGVAGFELRPRFDSFLKRRKIVRMGGLAVSKVTPSKE